MMDGSRPDLNLLLALNALLAERNVTRAAARLNLSQPALSAQLRRLREIFGDPLLVPARRGVVPTPRALELQAPLREALQALRYVVAERVQFDPSTTEFSVAIAASDYAQCALLERFIEIQREAPKFRLSWRQLYVPELVAQMEQGDVDLAVMTPNTAPKQLLTRPL
jgi:DNA-binding transcriptional LysR family regulator